MPDIAMCRGDGCPLKKKCHRYTALPWAFQFWFTEIPYDKQTKKCEQFMSNKEYKPKKPKIDGDLGTSPVSGAYWETRPAVLKQFSKEAQEMGLYD